MLDLDRLAALAEQAPADIHRMLLRQMEWTRHGLYSGAPREACDFYDAMKQAAPALIAAARERDALLARAQQAEADAAQLRAALTATMQRATGYDWNADPDNITLLQSEALHV